MLARKLLATATLTAALVFGTVAMAQMTNDTMGGTNRSGMQSGQPMMQSGAGDDARMATGTTRMKPAKHMRTKKMKRSRMMMRSSKPQMGNDTMRATSGMSKSDGGRGGTMGGNSGM